MDDLLEELVNGIGEVCEEVDKSIIREKFKDILKSYIVKPNDFTNGESDINQKINIFISGKRLEGLSELTLSGYEIELKLFGKHIDKLVENITTNDIRMYLGKFNKLKTSSMSKKISILKSFFSWLRNEEIIDKDNAYKIKTPKKEKRLPKALTIDELEMIREACVSSRERALIEVLYATGCRLSEVQKMNREDIDLQAMSTNVIGKGNKERHVYFSFKALYHLKKYLLQRLDSDPALFVSERKPNGRLSCRGIEREIKVIAGRSEVKKNVHPHILRHTFATLLINNGASLVAVQELLGHEDPSTTLIYARMTEEKTKQSHKQYLVQ